MSAALRLLRWLADSLPVHSTRHVAKAWLRGYEVGQRALGLTRDRRGRFRRVA